MADPFFCEIKGPEGLEMLLNLDVVLAIGRQKDGSAVIVSIAGGRLEASEPYATFKNDLLVPPG